MYKSIFPTFNKVICTIGMSMAMTTLYGQAWSILGQNFKTPPLHAKPRALWTWVDGNFDKESITYELEQAKAKGMGGFDIWDVVHVQDEKKIVPPGKAFMGEEFTDAVVHAINEATRLDLEMGLIVASGWNAGGAWTKPEHATMGMYRTQKNVIGPKMLTIKMPFPALPERLGKKGETKALIEWDKNGLPVFYKDIKVLAFPITKDSIITDPTMVKDLTSLMDKDGNMTWSVPPGAWKIVRMVCANTGQPMIAHTPNSEGPMIDHYNPQATEIHIKYFIDKLLARLGSFEGKSLKYLYSDSYEVIGELWTPQMISAFEAQFGYSMTPFLPVFQGYTVVSRDVSARFLYDYRQLLSDLIIKSHYLKAKEVCNKYGIGYVAEAAGPGKPLHNCPFESLKSSGVLTHPRGEFWHKSKGPRSGSQDILQVIKGVASASHIYDQKIVDAEAFTSVWLWQESLDELKPTVDNAFCEGLNRVVFHTFPHVPKAAGKPGWIYGFGTQISVHQPWWPKAKPFMDYLGRCSYLLQQGNFAADVLFYYGDEAPNFVPAKHINPALGYGYDYDVVNTDVILNRLEVKNGKFTLPHGPQYSVLVLPAGKEMNLSVLQKIEKFVKAGGVVIGPKPERSTGYKDFISNDQSVKKIANEIWASAPSSKVEIGKVIDSKSIREVLAEINVTPDFNVSNNVVTDSIDFIHRKAENRDIYFVRSKYSKTVDFTAVFRSVGKQIQVWDPLSGEMYGASTSVANGSTSLAISLTAFGSIFVVFENESIFPNLPSATKIIGTQSTTKVFTITGEWKLSFPQGQKAPQNYSLSELKNLSTVSEEGVRYFSGIITYEKEFDITEEFLKSGERAMIDLGSVAIVADVTLNGKSIGTRWNSPFVLDISSTLIPGKNKLKIEVANRWTNRLIGDSKLPEKEQITNTNITRLPSGWSYPLADIPNKEYDMLPSGLIGPVTIKFIKN